MSNGAHRRADGPDGVDAHLEPVKRREIKTPRASEHLDRLLGDSDLLLRLQLSGYAAKEWAPVATEFARYGLGVLSAWLSTGQIFREVKSMTGIALTPHDGGFDDEARSDLATDTVVAALPAFLQVLKDKRWDPAKGASLKTYFIGQCKWQFPNVYRKWQRRHDQRIVELVAGEPAALTGLLEPAPSADRQILAREQRQEALALLSTHKARVAFSMAEMGYTHEQIAEQIGLADDKAVENLLGHQRRRVQQQDQARRRAQ